MATLLQLVQMASQEMGLSSPTSVIGNQSQDVVQTLALINAVGNELRTQHDWQRITKPYIFNTQYLTTTGTWTTSANTITGIPSTATLSAGTWLASSVSIPPTAEIQSVDSSSQVTLNQTPTASGTAASITFTKTKYAFPSDYDHLVDNTEWDQSRHWQNLGPETGQQWAFLKSGFISTGPRVRFRPLGGYFQIWPGLASTDTMYFEYVSNQWVLAVADTITPSKGSFTVDTDTCVFPDRLMVLGVKVKYFGIKGFSIGAPDQPGTLMYDYMMQLNIAKANDAGSATLSMSPVFPDQLLTTANIPDTGFGQE